MVKRSFMAYDEAPVASATATTTELKIKITKRELEMLLANYSVVEVKEELQMEHLLSPLFYVDGTLEMQPRSWQPSLQSIPEAD